MKHIEPVGRKHDDCETCDKHPLFDLDDTVFIHGRDYTKEQILIALEIADDKVVDDYPHYFNVENGLFNLDTMQLESHRKEVYVTAQAGFSYDAAANASVFKEWLSEMLAFVLLSHQRPMEPMASLESASSLKEPRPSSLI